MERCFDVIVNDTVYNASGELVTFSGILRAREVDSSDKARPNEWCNLYGDDTLFAIDTDKMMYRTDYIGEFRHLGLSYSCYSAVSRMVNRALRRCGITFEGYTLTDNGDLVKDGECLTLEDGRIFMKCECSICKETGLMTPNRDMRLINGEYHLKTACETCPECGRWMIRGDKCGYCNVLTWDGRRTTRKMSESVSAYVLNENGFLKFKRLIVLKGEGLKGHKRCANCRTYYPESQEFSYGMCPSCMAENMELEEQLVDGSDDEAVIGEYHYFDKDVWFGSPDKDGRFTGLGFELEIDGCPKSENYQSRFNNLVANRILHESGLRQGEVVFETDSSLISGFEIISMPHTVKEFWKNESRWTRMLEICSEERFKSHDTETCGLHVHVSRRMFGKSKELQDRGLAKVHKLYKVRWYDLVRASRRNDLGFCSPNKTSDGLDGVTEEQGTRAWMKTVGNGTHHSAINDSDDVTVEFRLGRGTLSPKSFFAWIDLTLAIVRNSRKSDKTLFSDPKEWISGIRGETAEYLLSRNSFKEECLALHPELGGEND